MGMFESPDPGLNRARKQAHQWTFNQAMRLEVMPKQVLEAIRRGHTAADIENFTSKYQLESSPGRTEAMADAINRMETAPMLPIPTRPYRGN